jgi:hypothetical protein
LPQSTGLDTAPGAAWLRCQLHMSTEWSVWCKGPAQQGLFVDEVSAWLDMAVEGKHTLPWLSCCHVSCMIIVPDVWSAVANSSCCCSCCCCARWAG